MHPVFEKLDFSSNAEPLPDGVSDELYEMCRGIKSPETAREVFDAVEPLLGKFRADKQLAVACGLLAEKQRNGADIGPLWGALQKRFPDDEITLRMSMRWFRRNGRTDDALLHLDNVFPNRFENLEEAKVALSGFAELKAWNEIDETMDSILKRQVHDRAILMSYIKALHDQSRYPEAAYLARYIRDRERMGQASQALLETVEEKSKVIYAYERENAADLIQDIIALAPRPRAFETAQRMVFFSGQLGTGGAERQMTRLAIAYRMRAEQGYGPMPEVWVKHARPETGGDFYRPALKEADVKTVVMTEEDKVALSDLADLDAQIKDMIGVLAPDVLEHTTQLIRKFRDHQTDVAYLWQDGGIVQSALAAILAGVPRIIASFRGLPPNLRRHFYRDELPVLYKAMASMPHVTLTANSQKSAEAYEAWLELEPGSIVVIPNAIPPIKPDGDETDAAFWTDVLAASSECTKTVLGVFRFDDNKRPLQWIDAAARYLERKDDTRFILLGEGVLSARAAERIKDLGLENRIFQAGIRSNVGFYMHKADLLMHLAQMEGLPNVLIEAQMAGTPVLATPAGGTVEVVDDGKSGLLLSDADTLPETELDMRLDTLLSYPRLLADLGRGAQDYTGERFALDTILDRTADLFDPEWRTKE